MPSNTFQHLPTLSNTNSRHSHSPPYLTTTIQTEHHLGFIYADLCLKLSNTPIENLDEGEGKGKVSLRTHTWPEHCCTPLHTSS